MRMFLFLRKGKGGSEEKHLPASASWELKGHTSYLLLHWSTQRAGGLYNMSVGQRSTLEPADIQTNWQMKAAYCTVRTTAVLNKYVKQYAKIKVSISSTQLSHDLFIICEIIILHLNAFIFVSLIKWVKQEILPWHVSIKHALKLNGEKEKDLEEKLFYLII